MKSIFPSSFLLIGAVVSLHPRAIAAEPEPLTLRQAIATALLENRTLKAEAFAARVAEARVLQAGVRPNPELTVEFENFLGTGGFSGVKGLETTLQLSQVLDLDGARDRRVEAAAGERALADSEYEVKRIDVLADVARRFTEAVADRERLRIAKQGRELGEQIVAAARTRHAAAVASPIEVNKARIALAQLQIEEEHAEHELAACRQSLAAVLGQATPSFGEVSGNLLDLPSMPDFTALATRLDNNPSLTRSTAEARLREAQLRLAQSLRRPGARVSGGLRRAESNDAVGIVAGVSVPLPVRDQISGAVREARERRAQVDAAADAMRLELRATLFAVYQEMSHARTAFLQLQGEVIPAAEETLALADRGYRDGRFSLLDLLEAQKAVIDLRRDVIDHVATFHRHVIEIERLLGGPLQPASSTATASR